MRKFIYNFLVFSLAWGLDYIVSNGLMQFEDYRFKAWNEMSRGEASSDMVIIGNSRALSHFEPWTIGEVCGVSVYNLGIGGYALPGQILKYRFYRLHNKKPAYIIMQVDYLSMQEATLPRGHESEQFMPLIYDKAFRPELKKRCYSFLDLNCPMYRYFGYTKEIKGGILEFFHIQHFIKYPSRLGFHYEWGKIDLERNEDMEPLAAEMNPLIMSLFDSFLEECQSEGIKVFLVNSPSYIERTNKTMGLDVVNDFFEKMAEKYGTDYINYEDHAIDYDPSLFAAAVHLNSKGAHLFSLDFANHIKAKVL